MKNIVLLVLFSFTYAFASIQEAQLAIDEGNYLAAIETIETILEENSENAEALYTLSRAKVLHGQNLNNDETQSYYRQAVDHAKAAMQLEPSNVQTYVELGIALGRLSQHIGILESIGIGTEMKSVLDQGLKLDATHFELYHLLAIWHLEAPWIFGGDTNQVVPNFEQSIDLNPTNIMLYVDYAESLVRLNKSEAALEQLNIALNMTARTVADEVDLARAQALQKSILEQ